MKKINVLISSCLLGINCKYNGGNNLIDKLDLLKSKCNLIPFCPESIGGLTTPRTPSEIINNKVINKLGVDVSNEYAEGAVSALNVCKFYDIKYAILKSNSPSCGFGKIYDGTFSSKLVKGNGITANLLSENKIVVYNENQIEDLLKLWNIK